MIMKREVRGLCYFLLISKTMPSDNKEIRNLGRVTSCSAVPTGDQVSDAGAVIAFPKGNKEASNHGSSNSYNIQESSGPFTLGLSGSYISREDHTLWVKLPHKMVVGLNSSISCL